MIEAAIRNGYSPTLENQADRLGLGLMVEAGYDPRQAPAAWKAMTKKLGDHSTNLFWSEHDNNATRRSYLMCELKNNYRDFDYSKLRTGDEEFARMASLALQTSKPKRKIKIKNKSGSKESSNILVATVQL